MGLKQRVKQWLEIDKPTAEVVEVVKVTTTEDIVSNLKAFSNSAIGFTNFNSQIFPTYQAQKNNLVYQKTDDIYSVASRLASIAAMIPLYGEGKDKSDLPKNDKLDTFLETLTFDKKYIYYLHKLIDGEIFAYKDVLEFGVNKGLKSLTAMIPAAMVVNIDRVFPYTIIGYTYYNPVYGDRINFEVKDIMFNKSYNPSLDIQEIERGLSPVRVLCKRLTRVDASLDISIAQMQNGGVPGWLYLNNPAMSGKDAVEVMGMHKENYSRYATNKSNKGAPYIAGGEWGYISIGSTLADLDLAQLTDIDFDKICNVYNVSSTLFNNKKASTESNVEHMVSSMYTNAIMPLVMSLVDSLNEQVVPDINTKGRICYDFSDVPELQKSVLAKAKALGELPIMIPNDLLEAVGYDRRNDDENMDKVYIKNGYTLIDDVAVPVDNIPNTANDYVPAK